jgi:hypothetical protein
VRRNISKSRATVYIQSPPSRNPVHVPTSGTEQPWGYKQTTKIERHSGQMQLPGTSFYIQSCPKSKRCPKSREISRYMHGARIFTNAGYDPWFISSLHCHCREGASETLVHCPTGSHVRGASMLLLCTRLPGVSGISTRLRPRSASPSLSSSYASDKRAK